MKAWSKHRNWELGFGRKSKYSRSFDFCSNNDIQGRDAGSPTTGPHVPRTCRLFISGVHGSPEAWAADAVQDFCSAWAVVSVPT
jgi:hypothetical protein